MKLPERCYICLYEKYSRRHPRDVDEQTLAAYQSEVAQTIEQHKDKSSPQIVEHINRLRVAYFGGIEEYGAIKRYFNQYMLEREASMQAAVDASDDPLATAVRYAMAGNLIDFGAFPTVEEDTLRAFLDAAQRTALDETALQRLRTELACARRLCYMTDNCGEIVADKVLLRTLRRLYPSLTVTVLVRGAPIHNDATREDAEQVDLMSVTDAIADSGCAIGGIVPDRLPADAAKAFLDADVRIAKGQGNYETLSGCAFPIHFIFLCKCPMFTERFGVAPCTGLLIKEG